MTCQEVTEFLMAYLDEELDPTTRQTFERHLSICPACVNYLRSYEATVRLARAVAAPDDAPKAMSPPEDLIQAILHARRGGDG